MDQNTLVVENESLSEIVIIGKDGIEYRYPIQPSNKRKFNSNDLVKVESDVKKCKPPVVNTEL